MSEVKKYRKLPVVIEAMQLNGTNGKAVAIWCNGTFHPREVNGGGTWASHLAIKTLEGIMTASEGDYIIKGVNGEFYPCKPDIFEKTYEEVTEAQAFNKKG